MVSEQCVLLLLLYICLRVSAGQKKRRADDRGCHRSPPRGALKTCIRSSGVLYRDRGVEGCARAFFLTRVSKPAGDVPVGQLRIITRVRSLSLVLVGTIYLFAATTIYGGP